jgi:Flp pilus assembly protein TadG
MTNTISQSSMHVSSSEQKFQILLSSIAETAAARSQCLVRSIKKFKTERAGNVAPIFATALLPIFMAVGGAIDFGRAMSVRTHMQEALDSAVLAGGRDYQLTGDTAIGVAAANSFFAYRFAADARPLGHPQIASLDFDTTAYKITASAQASVPTPFLSIAGIATIDLKVSSQSALKLGGTAEGQDLEVSLMIDVTGSMADTTASGNSKLADAKLAAKDLINTLMPDGYAGGTSTRVALVPFSQYVNVGSTYYKAVTNYDPPGSASTCVTERTGADKYTDDAPVSGSWIGRFTVNSNKGTLSCAPTAKLKPLTTDKAGLNTAIDALTASGWTAGHLGTAWAWYVLSDKWANVWPVASRPGAPSAQLQKVAVLMTDGDYNTYYRNNTASRLQAQALCAGMKEAGITVYTVAFGSDLSAQTKADMEACASSAQHYHDAADGVALRAAFRTIAISLSQLRLTQ